MILQTLANRGGLKYLKELDDKLFVSLLQRIIPKDIDITADLTISADQYILDLMRRRREARNAGND